MLIAKKAFVGLPGRVIWLVWTPDPIDIEADPAQFTPDLNTRSGTFIRYHAQQ